MNRKVVEFFRRKVDEETSTQEESCDLVDKPSIEVTNDSVAVSLALQPAITLIDSVVKPFHPPIDVKFPKVNVSSRDRSCQVNWC